MKKNLISTVLACTLTAALLVGCGNAATTGAAAASTDTAAAAASSAGTAAAGATSAAAASGKLTVIKVAASPTPHAEILAHVKDELASEGYDLEVTEFEDYVQPNMVVESGEFDANYFQHVPYLDSFNKEKGTHLVTAGKIHYEPMGIYPGTKKSLDAIADGDAIAVPNDTTNEARALLLLQDNGLIKLKDGADLTATVNDIAENTKNLKIVEVEAAQVSHQLGSVAYAVMNGNYAKEAGYSVSKDALAYESQDSEAAKTYVNIIAVKEGNENNPGIQALVKALKSDDTKKWINDNYEGAVIAYDGE
jgi:D-methionine transport system substrate-binding protein